MFWGGGRSTKPCVFPCKVAAGDDERYLVCAAVAAGVGLPFFFGRIVTVASSCFGCACVCVVIGCFGICACRSHWNVCMTLVIWCSGFVLSADFFNFCANSFLFKYPFQKCFKIVFLSLWRRDPVLELKFRTLLRVVLLCFATQSLQIAL